MKLCINALALWTGALALGHTPLDAQDTVKVFRGARILSATGSGAIEDGSLIIIGGKIQFVGGADLSVPVDAEIVECKGKVITPGLVDTGTTLGMSTREANEQGSEVTPQVRVLDAIDPTDRAFGRARRAGVTTIQITPGNRNVIGGLGVIVKNRGLTVREMLLREESGLRMTLGAEPSSGNQSIRGGTPTSIYARRPGTRMGVVWTARKAFFDALDHREQKTVPDPNQPPIEDAAGLEVLLRAIDRELLVQTTARAEHDIRTALRLADEFGYETLIEGATEAWRLADELAAAGVRVMISAPSQLGNSARRDGAELRFGTLARLAEVGVPFAIQTGAEPTGVSLVHEAMFAVRNGLDQGAALAAITRVPAEILGIDDRVGALRAGLDADFVIWSGSPFDPATRAEAVYIDGQEIQS